MQQQQADGSYQELWPKVDGWNKSQVLSDLTRELLGLESTSIPDDAFIALTIGKDSKAYRVKVTYPNGQPAVGFTVGGLTAFPALSLVTNANGIVMGSSTSANPTITVAQKYDDVKSYSGSFASTRMITDCNIKLSYNDTPIEIFSSQTITGTISSYATGISYILVGGGGTGGGEGIYGASGVWKKSGGGGRGGGYITEGNFNLSTTSDSQNVSFQVVIGSAGDNSSSSNRYGNDGGTSQLYSIQSGTSVLINSANGGKGRQTRYNTGSRRESPYKVNLWGGNGGKGGVSGNSGQDGGYIQFNDDGDDTGWNSVNQSPTSSNPAINKTLGNKTYSLSGGGGGQGATASYSGGVSVTSFALAGSRYGGGGGGDFITNTDSEYVNYKPKSGICLILYLHD